MAVRTAQFALEPVGTEHVDQADLTIPLALTGGTEADRPAADRFYTALPDNQLAMKDGLYLVTALVMFAFTWTPPVDAPDHPRPYARTTLWLADAFGGGGGTY